MRLLFVMLNAGYVRNYAGTIEWLVGRGHEVHLALQVARDKFGEDAQVQHLQARVPAVRIGRAPLRTLSLWSRLADMTRSVQDLVRYFEPAYADAATLRARAVRQVPPPLVRLTSGVARLGPLARRIQAAWLRTLEWLVPIDASVKQFVRDVGPDAVLVTPLVSFGSDQVDYLKASHTLGIPTGACVASWDNLTNKGAIRYVPGRVFVWNADQAREAEQLHGVAASHIVATGAQLFDGEFDRTPTRSREALCAHLRLPDDRPFVLYVGSSAFIAPDEASFVEAWIDVLRRTPALAGVHLVVRPHPSNAQAWETLEARDAARVRVWSTYGGQPFADDFRDDYLDALHHASAVVGINTSALLEAAIAGRPVFTILTPEFAHAQQGMPHFAHLVDRTQPLLHAADGLAAHAGQLSARLGSGEARDPQSDAFVRRFVRPFAAPATPILGEAIERLPAECARRPARVTAPAAVRWMATPLARAATRVWDAGDRPVWATLLLDPCVGGVVTTLDLTVSAWARTAAVGGQARRLTARTARRVARTWQAAAYETRQKNERVAALAVKRTRRMIRPARRGWQIVSGAIRRRLSGSAEK